MELLSINFFLLFTLTFVLYCILNVRYRNRLLLVASCLFAGWYYPPFLITAVAVALFTFFWAKWLDSRVAGKQPTRRVYQTGIVILVLSWLFFHYTGAAGRLVDWLLPNADASSLMSTIVFPLGMSFYTFQAIGYLTEIYWQEERAERNITDFLLYMLFFMKFLAGPIERSSDFIQQLKNPRPFDYIYASTGAKFMLLGLMKKLLIANFLSPHTAEMFNTIHSLSGVQLLMTCLLYPIELYADFSGYTDIAIGGAYLFGLKLAPNFDRPFSAKSTAELWRRWHMSLSFWVRDYIYVPLTASTRNWQRWGVYFSLITTFVLLGLWHGVGVNFAIYGLIQGVIICWEMRVTFFRTHLPKLFGSHVANTLQIIRTYLLFAFSLLFFKIASLADVVYYIRHISFNVHDSWTEMNIGMSDHACIVTGLSLLLLLIYEYLSRKENLLIKIASLPTWQRWAIYYTLVMILISFGQFDSENFIYLQF